MVSCVGRRAWKGESVEEPQTERAQRRKVKIPGGADGLAYLSWLAALLGVPVYLVS